MSTPIEMLGTIRSQGDTVEIAFDRHYATDPADLWEAVTDPERLARWFAPVEGDLTAGGSFTIRFDDGDIPECSVESCDAPTSYTWLWPHGDHSSHVRVEVLADGDDGARLRLVHTRLPLRAAPEYASGWQAYVRSLDAHLAGDTADGDWWGEFNAVRGAYAGVLEVSDGQDDLRA